MAAIDRSVYERFDITSADGTNSVDLRGGIVTFSYFENLFSPMITAQAIVVNTGNTVTDKKGDIQLFHSSTHHKVDPVVSERISVGGTLQNYSDISKDLLKDLSFNNKKESDTILLS